MTAWRANPLTGRDRKEAKNFQNELQLDINDFRSSNDSTLAGSEGQALRLIHPGSLGAFRPVYEHGQGKSSFHPIFAISRIHSQPLGTSAGWTAQGVQTLCHFTPK